MEENSKVRDLEGQMCFAREKDSQPPEALHVLGECNLRGGRR